MNKDHVLPGLNDMSANLDRYSTSWSGVSETCAVLKILNVYNFEPKDRSGLPRKDSRALWVISKDLYKEYDA